MEEIQWEEFVKQVAEYAGVEKEIVTKETNLYTDLCIDSLGVFSLSIYLTGVFKISVPLSSVSTIENVGDMYDLILEEGVPAG